MTAQRTVEEALTENAAHALTTAIRELFRVAKEKAEPIDYQQLDIDYDVLAGNIDFCLIAENLVIEYSELACAVDSLELSESIAEYIDCGDVAGHIELDSLAYELDHDQLAGEVKSYLELPELEDMDAYSSRLEILEELVKDFTRPRGLRRLYRYLLSKGVKVYGYLRRSPSK